MSEKISATQIRKAAQSGRKLDSLVGPAVAEYIRKTGLYRSRTTHEAAPARLDPRGKLTTKVRGLTTTFKMAKK